MTEVKIADFDRQTKCIGCKLVVLKPDLPSVPELASCFVRCDRCLRMYCADHVSDRKLCVHCTLRCGVCGSTDVDGTKVCNTCGKPVCKKRTHAWSCELCNSICCHKHWVYCIDCEGWSPDEMMRNVCWPCHEDEQRSVCRSCYSKHSLTSIRELLQARQGSKKS